MGGSADDVEKQQPLLPAAAAAGEMPSGAGGDCKACSCTSPTATRTLALVVLAAGVAFAAQLVAREEHFLCVFTSLLALPEEDGQPRLAWARAAAGQVLLWSFAMALLMSMACWVVESAALLGLILAVVFTCCAEAPSSCTPCGLVSDLTEGQYGIRAWWPGPL